MNVDEYAALDGLALATLVQRGEISSAELCEVAISAVNQVNPDLNFVAEWMDKSAAQGCATTDRSLPLAGLPMLVKDGVAVEGEIAAYGCRMLQSARAPTDAEFVRRLKNSGVVVVGSSTAPEFGTSATTESELRGKTRNPWNQDHSPGGSSGGASAAVASRAFPIAMGSDGGGSIRTPAHCCGVFGLKPSRARNPIGPTTSGGLGNLGAPHAITLSVRDSAALLDAVNGPERGAPYAISRDCNSYLRHLDTRPPKLRIAYSTKNPSGEAVQQDCVSAVDRLVELCADLGHQVFERTFEYEWVALMKGLDIALGAEIGNSLKRLSKLTGLPVDNSTIEWINRQLAKNGEQLVATDVPDAMAIFHKVCMGAARFFEDVDLYLTPTAATTAPKLDRIHGEAKHLGYEGWLEESINRYSAFTPVFNITGQPAMSVPVYIAPNGLPVGAQIAGRFGDEHVLLRLATELEEAIAWGEMTPPLSATKTN